MKRDGNIFAKNIKKVIALYSAIVSIFTLSINDTFNNSVKPIHHIERRDVKVASRGRVITKMYVPELETPVVEVIESEEDEVEVSDDVDVASETIEENFEYLVDEVNYEVEEVAEVASYNYTYETPYTEDEIYLMAKVCLAEAEGESYLGKCLVVSAILNRVESGYYSNSVYDVIFQPYQFEVTANGRLDRVTVTDDIIQMVRDEIINRTNYNVIYFRTGYYSEYGTPLFQEGSHYFSGF